MQIILNTLNKSYDITTLVDPMSISILSNLEADTFNSGTINLISVHKNVFNDLDMSRPIPNYSIITFELGTRIISMYVSEDLVANTREDNTHYNHFIKLIEPLKVLTRINVPATTITQPKELGFVIGEKFSRNKIGSMSKSNILFDNPPVDKQEIVHLNKVSGSSNAFEFRNYEFLNNHTVKMTSTQPEIRVTNSNKTIVFNSLENTSPNINGMTVVNNDNEIALNVFLKVMNPYFNLNYHHKNVYEYSLQLKNAEQVLIIEVLGNGVVLATEEVNILGGTPTRNTFHGRMNNERVHIYTDYIADDNNWAYLFRPQAEPAEYEIKRTFKLGKLAAPNTDLSVRVRTKNTGYWQMYMSGEKIKGWFLDPKIPKIEESKVSGKYLYLLDATADIFEFGKDAKYLDYYINKLLRMNENHNIILDNETRSRLSTIKAPEFTYDANNLYEIIADIGRFIEAVPTLDFQIKTKTEWALASLEDYNLGTNKITIDAPSDSFIKYLNWFNADAPYGTVAKRIVDEEFEFYEITSGEYNLIEYRLYVTIPELGGALDVMYAFKTQHHQYYDGIIYDGRPYNEIAVRADDGHGYSYWALKLNNENLYAKVIETAEVTEYKVLKYTFYNDLENEIKEPPNVQQEVKIRPNEDYVSNIELNTNNLVGDDFYIDTGFIPIQTDSSGNNQKTTNNLGLELNGGEIYKVKKCEIQLNQAITLTDNQVIPANKVYDITDLLVEKSRYDTLLNISEYTLNERRLAVPTKNQVLYYVQGDNKIYNMSFTGTKAPTPPLGGTVSSNRAIYECVARKIVEEYGVAPKGTSNIFDPGDVLTDNLIRFRLIYIPFMTSRTTIFKDDQSGFELELSRFFNESSKINDPITLSKIAQSTINRIGNTQNEISGYGNYLDIPKVGTKDNQNRILTSINEKIRPNRVDYTATYIKDYSIKNKYVGIESAHRQYEISKDDLVLRIDKKVIKCYISIINRLSISNPFGDNLNLLFKGFVNGDIETPNLCHISTYNELDNHIVSVYRPVNAISSGKGFTWFTRMKDNYSAGTKLVLNAGNYWQQDIPYSDSFGNVNRILYRFGNLTPDYNVGIKFPESINNEAMNVKSRVDYVVDKDTREILALSQEVKYLSDNTDIIHIFDAIGKYNPLVKRVKDYEIRAGVLLKEISRATSKLSPNDFIYNQNNNIALDSNWFKVNVNANDLNKGVGIVIYEKNSNEPLIVIYKTSTGFQYSTIYFSIQK